MKYVFFLTVISFCSRASAQNNGIGIFDRAEDIGKPKNSGSSKYDETTQTYYMRGSGYNIWFNRDEFQYLYKKIGGNFILTGDFEFEGEKGDAHRKIGWMIRESADEAAASVNAVVHGDGLTVLQWRPLRGAYMRDPEDEVFYAKKSFSYYPIRACWKKITMRVASWGEPLQEVTTQEMPYLKDSVLAGLFISSHDSNSVQAAKIWNVRIDKPVPEIYHPNPQVKLPPLQGVVGCRLETMNVFDGKRMVIRESAGRFEAPNWMPGGDQLLFNEGGSLYTISVKGGMPGKLHTDFADRINNDHGISFNGKMLAISHSRQGQAGGGSTVYVLPLAGGIPKQVTQQSPSYWHGWAPNGKDVVLVGIRDSSKIYNLIKANIITGAETALTSNTTGHVDGPEYSPDGKYIYYNANPTGTMQIWRMKADGTTKEQLTFDEYHSWFPHISPDGKWIVMISFPTDIAPDSHPSYKKVMLRLMPVTGGAPRVIAHLYGGQGTINVNSWSPDSRHIAFVSNSEKK